MHLLWNLQLPTRPPPCHICKHHPNLVVDATSAGVKSSQMPAAPLPVAPAPVLGGIPDSTDRNTNAGEGARGILALFKKWEAHGTTTPTGAAVSMSLADATSLIALVKARFTGNVPLCESTESLLVGPGDVVQRIPPALRPLLQAVFRQTSFLPHVMGNITACCDAIEAYLALPTAILPGPLTRDLFRHCPLLLDLHRKTASAPALRIAATPFLRDMVACSRALHTRIEELAAAHPLPAKRTMTVGQDLQAGVVAAACADTAYDPPLFTKAQSVSTPGCKNGVPVDRTFNQMVYVFGCEHGAVYALVLRAGAENLSEYLNTILRFHRSTLTCALLLSAMSRDMCRSAVTAQCPRSSWPTSRAGCTATPRCWGRTSFAGVGAAEAISRERVAVAPHRAVTRMRRFCLDHFHARGHSACSPGYRLTPADGIGNSSAAEQMNNRLHALIPVMRYMRHDVAMRALSLFAIINNNAVNERLVRTAGATGTSLAVLGVAAEVDSGEESEAEETAVAEAAAAIEVAAEADAAAEGEAAADADAAAEAGTA